MQTNEINEYKESVNIVFIEDHPIIINSYIEILELVLQKKINKFVCTEAKDIVRFVHENKSNIQLDFAIIDYNLPPHMKYNIKNGRDAALFIKKDFPEAKIIMITSHDESFLMYELIKDPQIHFDAIFHKSEVEYDHLKTLLSLTDQADYYLSPTIKEAYQRILDNRIYLSKKNRDIVRWIADGFDNNEISKRLDICKSTLFKRKSVIKVDLYGKDISDGELIRLSRSEGYI
ncbi:MAG: LuxR C-terminal-related transcriptional regulator [Flavobacteriaceae bacterium]|nr:LuxR C-terminal-related transcriptional regulator [Flavobacteriaceae bacterium]